jgi:NTE family protein
MVNRFLAIFLITCFCISTTFAQENLPSRPKIGLVLSGGGAKGIAHIGVIKAMEAEGIRPDYIAGTSMGSIVGGLYAMGYSANQLEEIVRKIDWDQLLSNNIPLTYISYEEKEYYTRYLLELFIKNGSLKLPSGLIEGQMLSETLSHYTWPSNEYGSFDDFPIPFRCIATDVSTGKEIIFRDGPLSEAMRASMAIPTALTAADLDSTLAVDGGVLNNFPVEEVIKMGADIVIGINVSGGFEAAEEIDNMVGILLQISMIPSLERLEKQIKLCDIYIKPDLKDYATASFGSFEEIIELGDIAGEKNREKFRELAQEIGVSTKNDTKISLDVHPIIIDQIKLQGHHSTSKTLVLSKFGFEVGDTLSREELEIGIRRIYGISSFKKVIYHIDNSPDHHGVLTIKMFEKPEKILKAGLHYDNLFSAGISTNITLRNTIGRSSRSILAADISQNPRFRFDHLKYVGLKQKYAFNARYDYRNLQVPVYSKGDVQDIEINNNHIARIGLMSTQSLKQFSFFNLLYEFEGFKYKVGNIAPEGVKKIRLNRFYANLGYIRNTQNDRNYPSKGVNLDFSVNVYPYNYYNLKYNDGIDTIYVPIDSTDLEVPLSKDEVNQFVNSLTPDFYATLFFHYSRFTPLAKNFQFIPTISVGATFSNANENNIFNDFIIGGIPKVDFDDSQFYGLNYRELTAPNFGILGFYFQNVLFKKIFIQYGINGLIYHGHVPLNDLNKFDFENMFKNNSLIGYGAVLKYKSYIGPISLGLSYNNKDSNPRLYFSVGLSFNHQD